VRLSGGATECSRRLYLDSDQRPVAPPSSGACSRDRFLWEWTRGSLTGHFDAKAWLSTTASFAGSLWFYTVRFFDLNPQRSLLPCFAALATKNLGVLAIKYVQEFAGGWW
jgi:hypothetical protein